MSNLDVALASFWQIAIHWKQGDTAKLELLCEARSLQMQLTAKLGYPTQPPYPSSTSDKNVSLIILKIIQLL